MILQIPVSGIGELYPVKPSKIIAVGLNYVEHIEEFRTMKIRGGQDTYPKEPILFNKTPNVLIGDGQNIILPLCAEDYQWPNGPRTDHEGELVVVIGKRGKHIKEEHVMEHVMGYTCGNDVSQRNLQNSDRSGWFRGKSMDTFGPIGPCLTPQNHINPQSLNIETRLNGQVVQSSNTEKMIFPVTRLIAHISRQMTLEEGDLIFTGTPSGVGPLTPGDKVEVEIQGIGTLTNHVIKEEPL